MKRNKLQSSKVGQSLTKAILAGVIVASLISILLSALLANFVLNGSLREGSIKVITNLVRTSSVLVGALIGGTILKEKYLLQVTLTIFGYMLVLVGIGILFYDGSFMHFLSGVASMFVGGAVALIILQRPISKRRRTTKISL